MINDFGKRIAASFGVAGGIAVAVVILLLLPFGVVAVTRLTGWESWAALAALLALNFVPLAGQLVYVGLAVFGAYTLGQDNLAQRTAAKIMAAPVAAESKSADAFAEWRRKVAAPEVQDRCLQDAQRRGLTDGAQLDRMAKACACYGAAALTVIMPSDVEGGLLRPTPEFNERLSIAARQVCQR